MTIGATRQPRRRSSAQSPPSSAAAAAGPSAGTAALPDGAAAAFIEPERRHAMIAEAAFFQAERRGFAPGCELDDWLAAEREIDRALAAGETTGRCPD